MYELTDDQISYEEYQDLLKAIRLGAEKIMSEPGRFGIYGAEHLHFIKACTAQTNPSGMFKLYHETTELPEDQGKVPLVWDELVEYRGNEHPIKHLILRLEYVWNQFKMLNEGGA